MRRNLALVLAVGGLFFGSFSSSPHYDLNNYNLGAGGTNSTHSTTYYTQGTIGEQGNGIANGDTRNGGSGSIQTEQLSTPRTPTLSNGSGLYYNKLLLTINDNAGTNSYPTDVTFAVEVCSGSCSSYSYLQTDGSLNTSPVFQTYTAWGGASGFYITGLTPNTAYQAKVSAKEGTFTNTDYGPAGSATTANPSLTFSVSPNSLTLSNLTPGTIVTSSSLTFGFTTNAAVGGAVYMSGANGGLYSAKQSSLIAAYNGDLSTPTQGFGIQASNASESSGGPLVIQSPFNDSGTIVGPDSTVPRQMLTSGAPITSGSANADILAKASSTTPASSDYSETLTFVAAADF